MNPVLISVIGFEIRWYGLLLALAFLIGYFILLKLSEENGIKKEIIEKLIISLIIGVIVGARLFEVVFYDFEYYLNNPIKIFYVWEGGLASHGGLIAGIIIIFWFSKKYNIKFYELADLIVIPVALGASFIRIGNFINSELVGKITDVKWGVKFENHEDLRHPVQIYQAVTNFVTFLTLLYTRRLKNLTPGLLFWLFLLMFSVFRFFTEFYKDLPLGYGLQVYGLNLAQYLSIGIFVVSIIYLIKLKK